MSIHINENGTIKNTAVDGSRIAIRMWPSYVKPYDSNIGSYYFGSWVDDVDRPYLTITNPSVDYIWPFVPNYIVYMPYTSGNAYNIRRSFIIRQGAGLTQWVGSDVYGSWLAYDKPSGSTATYWVYGKSRISLSENAMRVTYTNIDRAKDDHSADDHRPVCGIFIAVAE